MIEYLRQALGLLARSRFEGPGLFLIGLSFSLLFHFGDNTVNGALSPLERIAIVSVVYLVSYSLTKFMRAYVFPVGSGGLQLLKTMTSLYVVAVVRGLMLYSMTQTYHLYVIDNLGFRLVNSIVNYSMGIAIAAIAVQAFREWRTRRTELLQTNSRLEALLKAEAEKDAQWQDRLVDNISGQLVRFIDQVDQSMPEEAVANLRNGIDQIVRPLSHQIHEREFEEPNSEKPVATLKVSDVLRRVGEWRPLEPLLQPLSLLAIDVPYQILHFGFNNLVLRSILGMLVAGLLLELWNRLFVLVRPRWQLAWPMLLAASASAGLGTYYAIELLAPTGNADPNLASNLVFAHFIFAVIFACTRSLFRNIRLVETELVDQQAQLSWAVARETEVQRQRARAVAKALHGPVQTAVGVGIIRLENAAKLGAIPRELVTDVTDQIYSSIDQLRHATDVPRLVSVIDDLETTWAGICSIQLDADDENMERIARDQVSVTLMAELIPELAFNSIKHGDAANVRISIDSPEADLVTFRIEDDGQEFVEAGRHGLGLKRLQESAVEVVRTFRDGKNTTLVRLPYQVS